MSPTTMVPIIPLDKRCNSAASELVCTSGASGGQYQTPNNIGATSACIIRMPRTLSVNGIFDVTNVPCTFCCVARNAASLSAVVAVSTRDGKIARDANGGHGVVQPRFCKGYQVRVKDTKSVV